MNTLKNMISKLFQLIMYIYYKIFSSNLFKININKRFLLNWNNKYLLNHKLNKDSIVFEVGWYTGVFSENIIGKYDCHVYIFEPVKEFYEILVSKFRDNSKVHLFDFWLSDKTKQEKIYKTSDWTSIYRKNLQDYEIIQLIDIDEFLNEHGFNESKTIDLVQINIEGGEYDLLPRIISKHPNTFNSIQVQFHDFVTDSKEKRDSIIKGLKEKNYKQWFSFPFVREFFYK